MAIFKNQNNKYLQICGGLLYAFNPILKFLGYFSSAFSIVKNNLRYEKSEAI